MSLTNIDLALASAASLTIKGSRVPFQFPPKVTSDSKAGDWKEEAKRGLEPTVVWTSGKSRTLAIEWTYIVGEKGPGGYIYTTEFIKQTVAWLRAYYIEKNVKGVGEDLIAKLKLWLIGGTKEYAVRFLTIDVTHGKSIVVPDGNVNLAFPLRTDVKAKAAIWTDNRVNAKAGEAKIRIKGLEPLGVEFDRTLKNSWA